MIARIVFILALFSGVAFYGASNVQNVPHNPFATLSAILAK